MRALLLLLWWLTLPAHALTLAWDASPDASAVGYTLHYGPASGNYTTALNAGSSLTATVANPAVGQTLFFVVTARNAASAESLPSNEVSFTQTAPKSSNSSLSAIQLDGAAIPNFVQTIGAYDVPVSNATAATVITAVVADARATVTCKGVPSANGTWQTGLLAGPNLFPIVVTAEDGTSRTYNLTVTRLPPPPLPASNLRVVAP